MKKILGLAALSLILILSGCNDDATYNEPAVLKLIKADVQFDAQAAEGLIEVEPGGELTALPDQTWCTASVSGNIVTVNVTRNSDINGRYANIKLSDGEKTAYVSVSQQGMHLDVDKNIITISDAGGTGSVVYTANHPVEISDIEGGDGWLDRKISGNTITLTANPIGNALYGLREATMSVSITAGDGSKITETITIKQARPLSYEDMLGDWKFTYTDIDGNRVTGSLGKLQANGDDRNSFEFLGALSTASVNPTLYFDPALGTVKLKAGEILTSGNILGVVLEAVIVAGDGEGKFEDYVGGRKVMTRLTSVEYEGRINTITTKNKVRFVFSDNGTWPGRVVKGLDRAWIINGVLSDILYSYYDCELYRE